MPRLSLESSDPKWQESTVGKVSTDSILEASCNLREAGYPKRTFGAYILPGVPGQELSEVSESIRLAHETGSRVFISEYPPIQDTKDWENSKYLLPNSDPLLHNNSTLHLFPVDRWRNLTRLNFSQRH